MADFCKTNRTKNRCEKFIGKLVIFSFTTCQIGHVYAPKDNLYTCTTFASGFTSISDLTTDPSGNLYVADGGNNRISKVDSSGHVTTQAVLGSTPQGIAYHSGQLYITDASGNISQLTVSNSAITTIATGLNLPEGLCCDASGNLYVADANAKKIYSLTYGSWIRSVLAGSSTAGYTDASGTHAAFQFPQGVTVDNTGTYLYVDDSSNNRIRKIEIANGNVTTLAGNANGTLIDGIGPRASFNYPTGSTMDSYGNLFVADSRNGAIRKITPSGIVTTINSYNQQPSQFLVITMNTTTGVIYSNYPAGAVCAFTPNYFGPQVVDTPFINADYGTEPITFAGGVMNLLKNIKLTNPIILSAPSIINTNGFTLDLSDATFYGYNGYLSYLGSGNVLAPHGISVSATIHNSNYLFVNAGDTASASNSYIGGIILNGGTLDVSSDLSVPVYFYTGSPVLKANAPVNITGAITLISNGTIDANGHSINIEGGITGFGGITFESSSGTAAIHFDKVNTYSGPTTIDSTITAQCGASDCFSKSENVEINGTFDLNGYANYLNDVSGSGKISDSQGGSRIGLSAVRGSTFAGTFDNTLGEVTTYGSGVLQLTGDNSSYSHIFDIFGILRANSASNLGSSDLRLTKAVLQTNVNMSLSLPITLYGNSIIDTLGHSVDLSGAAITDNGNANPNGTGFDITVLGSGTVTFPSGYAGSVTAANGSTIVNTSGPSNSLILSGSGHSGSLSSGNIIIQDGTYQINNNTIRNNICFYNTSGTGSPELQIGADLALSNAIYMITDGTIDMNGYRSTYTGTFFGNAKLTITDSSNRDGSLLFSGINSANDIIQLNSGKLIVADHDQSSGSASFTLAGGILKITYSRHIPKNITLAGDSTIDVNGNTIGLSGNISGNGQLNVMSSGSNATAGILGIIGINNSGAWSTNVHSGTLAIFKANNLGSGDLTLSGGTLRALADLNITQNMSVTAASNLDTNGYAVTYSGTLTGRSLLSIMDSSENQTGSFSSSGGDSTTIDKTESK